ncbi:MAG: hypothetical protein V4510_10165 [bacterium]
MAGLELGDVVLIGAVATVGFTLLCYWYSGVMAKRNWSYQVKPKPKKAAAEQPGAAKP